MTDADGEHRGRCYSGRVRYVVRGPVRDLSICHCESCRRAAGAVFVAWGTVDVDRFEVVVGSVSMVRANEQVERGYCGNCGTSLTYRNLLRAGELDFTLASLEDPSALRPQMHIWVRDKVPWVELGDGLPQYETVFVQGVEAEKPPR